MFPEGKGLARGWKTLSNKLRQLGVVPKEESRREAAKERIVVEPPSRLLSMPTRSLAEVTKGEKKVVDDGVCIVVEEEKVKERLGQLAS